jgi:hypothetical protein
MVAMTMAARWSPCQVIAVYAQARILRARLAVCDVAVGHGFQTSHLEACATKSHVLGVSSQMLISPETC